MDEYVRESIHDQANETTKMKRTTTLLLFVTLTKHVVARDRLETTDQSENDHDGRDVDGHPIKVMLTMVSS